MQINQRFYDNVQRLLSANYDGGAVEYSYGYDLAGNLVNNNGTTRTFNSANQLTGNSTDTFEYDSNGNLWKTNSVVSHTWDRANRLLSHGGLDYAYDGLGNRISQDNGTDVTSYLLDLQSGLPKVLAETVGANVTSFVHSPRGLHATQNPADAWFYSLQDGLGSQRAEIGANVAVVGSQEFTPYGVVQNVTGSFNSPHAFTGEPLDANGLQYHRARYYDPAMGVWANQDFLETSNRYFYASSNPINRVDHNGLLDGSANTLPLPFGEVAKLPDLLAQIGAIGSGAIKAVGAVAGTKVALATGAIALPVVGAVHSLFNPIEPHWTTELIEPVPEAPDAVYQPYGSSQTNVFPTGATPYDYMQSPVAPTTANPAIPMPNGLDPKDLADICNAGVCGGLLSLLLSRLAPAIQNLVDNLVDNADKAKDNPDNDIVYRNPDMSRVEHPFALIIGFHPKNPLATYAPAFHIARGSTYSTQWISVTRSLAVALDPRWKKPGIPVYAINLKEVFGMVLDFTVQSNVDEYLNHPIPRNLATNSAEVLIAGVIPPFAIKGLIP